MPKIILLDKNRVEYEMIIPDAELQDYYAAKSLHRRLIGQMEAADDALRKIELDLLARHM